MVQKVVGSSDEPEEYGLNYDRGIELIPASNILRGALDNLGPLYHSYSFFGVENEQIAGIYKPNQVAKSQIISIYIAYAFARVSAKSSNEVSFAELFCADGYYTMVARNLGFRPCYGIDNNRENHTNLAPEIAERLGLNDVHFISQDITPESSLDNYDVVANVGGLYHTERPEKILDLSYDLANKFLIVQNVVSLANNSESYFESPAPGWTWGSRYSKQSFDALVRNKFGKKIIYSHFNELTGNDRPEDRGSLYYLIEK
jgi:hypothetical protein